MKQTLTQFVFKKGNFQEQPWRLFFSFHRIHKITQTTSSSSSIYPYIHSIHTSSISPTIIIHLPCNYSSGLAFGSLVPSLAFSSGSTSPLSPSPPRQSTNDNLITFSLSPVPVLEHRLPWCETFLSLLLLLHHPSFPLLRILSYPIVLTVSDNPFRIIHPSITSRYAQILFLLGHLGHLFRPFSSEFLDGYHSCEGIGLYSTTTHVSSLTISRTRTSFLYSAMKNVFDFVCCWMVKTRLDPASSYHSL